MGHNLKVSGKIETVSPSAVHEVPQVMEVSPK